VCSSPLVVWGTASACAVLRLWCGARLQPCEPEQRTGTPVAAV